MTELGNCAACRQPFHHSPQQHDCKDCGGKIHSSIHYPKCPKVVDHEEDNWCSDRCLYKNWPHPESCPLSISNADPLSTTMIGLVRVVESGGVSSTVVVYNDSLCIQFNEFFVDTWTQLCSVSWTQPIFTSRHQKNLCTVSDFTNFHFTSPKKSKTSWASLHNEVIYFTKVHFTSFNEVMG